MDKHCPKCGKPSQVVGYADDYIIIGCPEHREYDKVLLDSLISITEEDVWALAESKNIAIPEDKRVEVLETVKKYLESFCFDPAYNIWDAIKDAIKEALK